MYVELSFNTSALIIQVLSLNVLINSLSGVQVALLNRQLKFKGLAVRYLIGQVSGSCVGITLALMGWGVWSLVIQTIISSSISLLLLWKISYWRPGLKISKRHFQELFSFGINVVGIGALAFVILRADDFMIGYFLGPVALGYYTVAYKLLITITQLLGDVTNKVALPTFSKFQSEPEKLRRAFYYSTQIISIISVPSFVGMAILSPEIVNGLFGSQWSTSIPVMQVLAAAGIIKLSVHFFSPSLMALGKPSLDLQLALLNTVIRVIGFFIAIRWGIVAVAFSIVICSSLFIPIRILILKRLIDVQFRIYFGHFYLPVGATLAMSASIFLAKYFTAASITPQAALALYIAIGVFTYSAAIWIISPQVVKQLLSLIGTAKSTV